MVKNDFAYTSSIATLATTGGEEKEQDNKVGRVSTILKLLAFNT